MEQTMTETKGPLELLVQESRLERTKAQKVLDNFTAFFNEASTWEAQVKDIVVNSVDDVAEMALAKKARLALKNIRVNAEKTKKQMKENILIEGRLIDGIYNAVVAVTKPLENELLEKEKFAERLEQERIATILQKRERELQQYDVDVEFFDLGNMPEPAYQQLLSSSKTAYEKRIEDERKAETARMEAKKAEAERIETLRLETLRLAKIVAVKEKALQKARDEKAAEAARKIAEEKAEAAKSAAAALAPDKEKFVVYCDALLSVTRPDVKQEKLLRCLDNIIQVIRTIKEDAQKL